MTKKQLEKKVADLEAKIAELTSAMFALSLKTGQQTIFIPSTVPTPQPPLYPTWPYIGDPMPGTSGYPIITC